MPTKESGADVRLVATSSRLATTPAVKTCRVESTSALSVASETFACLMTWPVLSREWICPVVNSIWSGGGRGLVESLLHAPIARPSTQSGVRHAGRKLRIMYRVGGPGDRK